MALELHAHELLVISDRPMRDKPGDGYKIRVVQWMKGVGTVAAESISVKLECGKYKLNAATGETRFFPSGWGLKDLDACAPHMKQVRAWMASPPPVPPELRGVIVDLTSTPPAEPEEKDAW